MEVLARRILVDLSARAGRVWGVRGLARGNLSPALFDHPSAYGERQLAELKTRLYHKLWPRLVTYQKLRACSGHELTLQRLHKAIDSRGFH